MLSREPADVKDNQFCTKTGIKYSAGKELKDKNS